jgi:serine/threonine-protein kinase
MGALRSGGQGSVYKGRRIGPIITAIKLLPTPIHNESEEDKNYRNFRNEVEKLKKVNQEHNPNVVKILSYGITESGSLPFIEMEYIEGPDLEELLKPPHDPVFSIKEAIKVADQLACALMHCHKADVKHGDIKSNNIKFNKDTGNYMLLDFGLAVMSDEQRRTSLRQAGAIEFMAPEQNEGVMLFQTDIYGYGVILYELLAGEVPFPLNGQNETARNAVWMAHLETPVPDLLEKRRANLPQEWMPEKKDREMQVPEWLLAMIYKCLEKDPEHRYATGVELQDALVLHLTKGIDNELVLENERLKALVAVNSSSIVISRAVFIGIIFLLFGAIGFNAYLLFSKKEPVKNELPVAAKDTVIRQDTGQLPVAAVQQPKKSKVKQTDTVQIQIVPAEQNDAPQPAPVTHKTDSSEKQQSDTTRVKPDNGLQ